MVCSCKGLIVTCQILEVRLDTRKKSWKERLGVASVICVCRRQALISLDPIWGPWLPLSIARCMAMKILDSVCLKLAGSGCCWKDTTFEATEHRRKQHSRVWADDIQTIPLFNDSSQRQQPHCWAPSQTLWMDICWSSKDSAKELEQRTLTEQMEVRLSAGWSFDNQATSLQAATYIAYACSPDS